MVHLLRAGGFRVVFSEMRKWLYSNTTFLVLCRDLTLPFDAPPAKIPLTIRPLEDGDISNLFNVNALGITSEGFYYRANRLYLLKAGIGTCYVAVASDNTPCYMEWLFTSRDNEKIAVYFQGLFAALAPDEAQLEGTFTIEEFRGQHVMPYAECQIAQVAKECGIRRLISYVNVRNKPALKGAQRAGFAPYLLRTDEWRLFRRHCTSTPLPTGTPYPFDVEPSTEKNQRENLANR